MRRLQPLTEPTGHVLDLVGDGWAHRYRVLNPAREQRDGRPIHLRWSEVAASRGVRVDLRSAGWHDVSGFRLHNRKASDTPAEPETGPTSSVLLPVLRTLTSCRQIAEVTVAEWNGYDEELAGRQLEGAVLEDAARPFGDLDYSVWRTPVAQAADLIAADRIFNGPPARVVLANFIWDDTEDWLVAADGDLASTYVATQFPITNWPLELEWVEVSADAPLG